MATAVSVHTRPESMLGPSMAIRPSRTGDSLREAPCIIDAVPMPASLTSAARRAPMMAMPARAPMPALRLNASLNMLLNTAGTPDMLVIMMYSTIMKYTPTMNGTSTVATRAMRLMPPRITTATTAAMAQPNSRRYTRTFSRPRKPPTVLMKLLEAMPSGVVNVLMNASVSWLAFIMHMVPKRPAMAKNRARGFHFWPRPRSMMCMGPP